MAGHGWGLRGLPLLGMIAHAAVCALLGLLLVGAHQLQLESVKKCREGRRQGQGCCGRAMRGTRDGGWQRMRGSQGEEERRVE